MADEKFHQADELGDEKNECEDEEAKKSVANDFTNNVAIEDAHDGKGQCNMGTDSSRCGDADAGACGSGAGI